MSIEPQEICETKADYGTENEKKIETEIGNKMKTTQDRGHTQSFKVNANDLETLDAKEKNRNPFYF